MEIRSSQPEVFDDLKNLEFKKLKYQSSQENICARACFLIKLQASDLQLYLKSLAKFLITVFFIENLRSMVQAKRFMPVNHSATTVH